MTLLTCTGPFELLANLPTGTVVCQLYLTPHTPPLYFLQFEHFSRHYSRGFAVRSFVMAWRWVTMSPTITLVRPRCESTLDDETSSTMSTSVDSTQQLQTYLLTLAFPACSFEGWLHFINKDGQRTLPLSQLNFLNYQYRPPLCKIYVIMHTKNLIFLNLIEKLG